MPNAGGLCVGCEARQIIDRGRGDGVEDRGLPAAGPVRAWCPRPTAPQALDDARTVLVVHRLDPRIGRCATCAADCPCPPALDAARVLAQAGAWNTMPFPSPADPHAGPDRTTTASRWVAHALRLVRRLPWVAAT